MKFGQITTVKNDGENISIDVDRYHDGGITAQYKIQKEKFIVANKKEETKAFLKFSEDIEQLRATGMLVELSDDPTTRPMFMLDFSPKYKNGYMVITSWTVRA